MSELSYFEYKREDYEKQITIKMTPRMYEDIKFLANNINKPMSEAIRFLIFLGINQCKVDE